MLIWRGAGILDPVMAVACYAITIATCSLSPARAADISSGMGLGPAIHTGWIHLAGEIKYDDRKRFQQVAQTFESPRVVVFLEGPGGDLIAGLSIGDEIHSRGWRTVALDRCESACAYIWVAGAERIVGEGAIIGFHAAVDMVTKQETGMGNALLGSYLTNMGFDYNAIAGMTQTGPSGMRYLTVEAAKAWGLSYVGNLPSEAEIARRTPHVPTPPSAFGTTKIANDAVQLSRDAKSFPTKRTR
jgi:hypothetical protein